MAISRGAGTEIIRTLLFEHVGANTNAYDLIIGVQHHIYTVLSIIINAAVGGNGYLEMYLTGYDAIGGTTDENVVILKKTMVTGDTFVWNDKFSFNGFEPTNFTGPMDDATKQDAIADQGSGVAQKLKLNKSDNSDQYEVMITFIDQNNA